MAPTAYEKAIAKRDVIENSLIRINSRVQNHATIPLTEKLIQRHEETIDGDVAELRALQAEILSLGPDTETDNNRKKFYNLCDAADSLCNSMHGIKINLSQASSSSVAPPVSSSTKLPRLDLQSFDGDILEWISFRDMFSSAVHQNSSIPKVQKLVYLKSLLRGEAARQIQSLVLSDNNYDTAWKLLHDRYQNDREILFSVLRRLFSQSNSSSSAMTIRNLVDSTKECIRSLEFLNLKPEKSTEAMILFILVEKLDQTSRQLWEQSLQGTSVPALSILFDFLEQRARAVAAATGPNSVPVKPKSHRGEESHKRVHTFHGQSSSTCKSCNGQFHPLYRCSKFLTMGIADRYEFLKKQNACFNCLTVGHSTNSCTSKFRCKQCKKLHHTLLHSGTNPEQSIPSVTPSQAIAQSHHVSKNSPSTQGLLTTAIAQVEGSDGSLHLCRSFLDSGSTASFVSESFVTQLGLKRRKKNVEVIGLASTNVGTAHGVVTLTLHPYFDKAVTFHVEALIIPKVTQNLPESLHRP